MKTLLSFETVGDQLRFEGGAEKIGFEEEGIRETWDSGFGGL